MIMPIVEATSTHHIPLNPGSVYISTFILSGRCDRRPQQFLDHQDDLVRQPAVQTTHPTKHHQGTNEWVQADEKATQEAALPGWK